MIGIYDYTVILTYLSVCSATFGLLLAFTGHPTLAMFSLMLSGFFDMFDGKVARTKKRKKDEIQFGIQIDSFADIIAFGVLPVAIGYSLGMDKWYFLPIAFIYVLAALIRLAYFNVKEEELLSSKKDRSKVFVGLPTTSLALILPLIFFFKHLFKKYFVFVYAGSLLIISILFVLDKKFIKKPDTKKMIAFIFIGIIEIALVFLGYKLWKILI